NDVFAHDAPNSDDGIRYARSFQHGSFGNYGLANVASLDARRGKEARVCVDRGRHIVKIEMGRAAGEIHIRAVERFHRSKVLPVPIEQMAIGIVFLDCARYDLIAEVDHRWIRQQLEEYVP